MQLRSWSQLGFGALACAAAVLNTAAAPVANIPRREIPILTNVDVLVVGGSLAGVAAALEAARSGASVYLITPRSYLGEDLCSTLRIWVDPSAPLRHPLVQAVFSAAPPRGPVSGPRLSFRYESDTSTDPRHPDSRPPRRLADGVDNDATRNSVQYNGPVTIVADLERSQPIGRVGVRAFQRPDDFVVGEVVVRFSDDQRSWSPPLTIRNPTPEIQAEDDSLALVADAHTTNRYVQFEIRPYRSAKRILLAELVIEGPEAASTPSPRYARVARPLHIQRTLEGQLIEQRIPFLFHSYVIEVLCDDRHQVRGVVVANRSGRQAILAKQIVDATPYATVARLAGAPFTPFTPGPQRMRRVVIGGQPVPEQPNVVRVVRSDVRVVVASETGTLLPVIEYELVIPLLDDSWPSLAAAEQVARDQTFTPEIRDAAEVLDWIPPNTVETLARAAGPWPGAHQVDLGAFRTRQLHGLWILSAYAGVDRSIVPSMRQPDEWATLGDRIGRAAVTEARTVPAESRVRPVQTETTGPTTALAGEVRVLSPDATPRFADLPRLQWPDRPQPADAEVDVIVVGGGTGGAPAGIGAARQGARTLVVETLYGLGGVGTWGQISSYYHGYRQGFTAEIDSGVAALAGRNTPAHRWSVEHKSEWLRRELRTAGVEIWFGCLGFGAWVESNQVVGVWVATPCGPRLVRARAVVDATGNADIAAAAGAPCTYTDEADLAVQGAGLSPRSLSKDYINTDYTFVDDTDVIDIWRVFVVGRELFADAWDLSRLIDTRERRRILGEVEISPMDLYLGRTWSDTIALAQSNFDTHGYTVHPIFTLRPPDRSSLTVAVPLRAFLPRGVEGLLVIGLGMSAHRDALPVLRMQPDIQNHGYAVGVAAAWMARNQVSARALDVRALQRHLVEKGIVPESVLTDTDTPPVPEDRLDWAVRSLPSEWTGLEVVLSDTNRALPKLRQAFAAATSPNDRLVYAQVLGMLGDPTGAEVLAEAVRNTPTEQGWDFRAMGQFGPSRAPVDALMLALGRTRSPAALEPLLEKARTLDAQTAFSHHRAVALALEALGDPRAAPVLAEVLRKPGMRGYAITSIEDARAKKLSGGTDTQARRNAMRELFLARALYRCGDHEGLGEAILREYARDLHGHYARHARAILEHGPRKL